MSQVHELCCPKPFAVLTAISALSLLMTLGCHDPFHSEGISVKQDRIEKNALFAKMEQKSRGV
jgi:hypothetical protein